jgi:hypothetical protein
LNVVGSGTVGVAVVEVDVVVLVLALAVEVSAVRPPEGASWTPGAVELPQPATATASATAAQVIVDLVLMGSPPG